MSVALHRLAKSSLRLPPCPVPILHPDPRLATCPGLLCCVYHTLSLFAAQGGWPACDPLTVTLLLPCLLPADYVRFNLPLGFTVATLAASLAFFPDGYAAAGMTGVAVDNIRWVLWGGGWVGGCQGARGGAQCVQQCL